MKITNSPYSPVHIGTPSYGESCFASYQRVVNAMVKSGELYLAADEHVVAVEVSDRGLTFTIEKKEK